MNEPTKTPTGFYSHRYLKNLSSKRPKTARDQNPSLQIFPLKNLLRKSSILIHKEHFAEDQNIHRALKQKKSSASEEVIKFPTEKPQKSISKPLYSIYKLEKSRSVATIVIKSYDKLPVKTENTNGKSLSLDRNITESSTRIISDLTKNWEMPKNKTTYKMKTQKIEFNSAPQTTSRESNMKKNAFKGENTVKGYPFIKLARMFAENCTQNVEFCVTSTRRGPFT
ncbi:hypothetical protein SteCoe_26062 [Stentor coeruleus]|uniref:Uncharacterized protein n=1 Tax=Stentor coeruleus TaxID=5963 RepID=A0A1R2BDR6_9CILI|nr:hypothetical protein SteCoe_26062 [Stentor coeruleus]